MVSVVPTTAMETGIYRAFQQHFSLDEQTLSLKQRICFAFAAGGASSLVVNPTEMVLVLMGKSNKKLKPTVSQLIEKRGVLSLYTGLFATVVREGGFTLFFLAAYPALKKRFSSYCGDSLNSNWAALPSALLTGIGTTLITHPADAIKTQQQCIDNPENFFRTSATLYRHGGMFSFFKGAVPRGVRVTTAIPIMSEVFVKAETLLQDDIASIVPVK